jgi:hypothetical protein
MNLIPNTFSKAPNYYCTWSTQNYGRDDADMEADIAIFEGDQGAKKARHFLNESIVFSAGGMIDQYDSVRGDLFFVFDDGWDVPYDVHPNTQRYQFGSLELDEERFPSAKGSPMERLKWLNEKVKSFGWRGAGLWVAAQAQGEGKDGFLLNHSELEQYWRERARWSFEAGIEYWKVDWGVRSSSIDFRAMLTRIAREEAPGLIVEHGRGCGPLNDSDTPWDKIPESGAGRFHTWGNVLSEALQMIAYSDVLRSYDVTMPLSTVSTLDRVASLLQRANINNEAQGLINCEDELYLGSALGCSVGIMRSSLFKAIPGLNYDPRNTAKSTDEAIRSVRWQRLAPAYRADQEKVLLSNDILEDKWRYSQGETWATWLIGKEIMQACPAVVSRGIELPKVSCSGEPPFVVASRNPNGAVSIATLPRTFTDKGINTPDATVEVMVGNSTFPIGIFGNYATLILQFEYSVEEKRVWAQDLAASKAEDITERIIKKGNRLFISGEVIHKVGLAAASPNDVSEPGLVLLLV